MLFYSKLMKMKGLFMYTFSEGVDESCLISTHWKNPSCTYKEDWHCVKSVRVRSYSGLHFPAFRLNAERYGVSLHIQSECGKIRTRITLNTDTFYAVLIFFTGMWSGIPKYGNKIIQNNSHKLILAAVR